MAAEIPRGELETKEWSEHDIKDIEPSGGRIPVVYVNNAKVGFTNWDAWVQFGYIVGQEQGKLLVEPRVRVIMSLEHMKAFVTALQDSVAQFESKFGDIKILIPIPSEKENE